MGISTQAGASFRLRVAPRLGLRRGARASDHLADAPVSPACVRVAALLVPLFVAFALERFSGRRRCRIYERRAVGAL
jgi:hypothetical protein